MERLRDAGFEMFEVRDPETAETLLFRRESPGHVDVVTLALDGVSDSMAGRYAPEDSPWATRGTDLPTPETVVRGSILEVVEAVLEWPA